MKRVILILLVVGIGVAIWWAERPRPQTLVLTGTVDGNEVVWAARSPAASSTWRWKTARR